MVFQTTKMSDKRGMTIAAIAQRIKNHLSSPFVRNVGWLTGAEFLNRITRLVTTITLTRLLNTYEYGLIAVVFTTIEFANVFTLRGGIGGKIIQVAEAELETYANSAYWLNWVICAGVFLLQCIAAFPVGWFFRDSSVIPAIWVVSLVYLIMPLFMVQGSLLQRENRMKVIAIVNVLASVFGNTLTIVLALRGLGIWAVVLPYVVSHFIWLAIYLREHPWRPKSRFTVTHAGDILRFAKNILGAELLDRFRANLDYLLIGRFLGIDALGLYYFAFNAGLGISLNIMGSFWYSLLPHLCSARDNLQHLKQKYFSSLKSMLLILTPIALLQTVLAPIYVPLVFGERWIPAIPILMLVCLSAIPRPLGLAASQLLFTIDRGEVDLYWQILFTTVFAALLLIAVQWGIVATAFAVLLVHAIALPLYSAWVSRYVFKHVAGFLD